MTGCCACPARSAALRSKGFGEAPRNSLITATLAISVSDCQSLQLLHDDRSGHFGMNGTEVGVSTRRFRSNRELLVRVEGGRFLELLLDAHDGVRFVVPVNPGHLFSGLHG